MTIYQPTLGENGAPRYVALADAIGRDVEAGVLAAGDRLPTHRELAAALGVSIGTVTRGYAEAERRGLVRGEVGRGTFVRAADPSDGWGASEAASGVVDLSLALPWTLPGGEEGRLLADTLSEVVRSADATELLRFQPGSATARHRRQAAAWLEGIGVPARPGTVVVTAGAQHALTVLLSSLVRPGDTVAVEELTYPGVKAAAHAVGVRLRGVTLDDEGLEPSSLDRAFREGATAVYCVPTAQNPTGATMSEARRREIVDVVRAHDGLLIEDDVHGLMVDERSTPLIALAPERTLHIMTVSKALAFGLRTALVTVPEALVERMLAGVRTTVWMAPPLMTEVTLRWLTDGTADALARRKAAEVTERQAIVREVLEPRCAVRAAPGSIHAWLQLPEPWRSDELVAQARARGVLVAGAEAFLVGRGPVPHAVRIALGVPERRDDLRRALDTLADVLVGGAKPVAAIV